MVKAIDLYLDFPADRYAFRDDILGMCPDNEHGYQCWRQNTYCARIGLDYKEVLRIYHEQGEDAAAEYVMAGADAAGIKPFDEQMEHFLEHMDDCGIDFGLCATSDHDPAHTMDLVNRYGRGRLWGMHYGDCRNGMDEVRKLEHLVKDCGIKALYISFYRNGVAADDARQYPLYAKACELGIPVLIASCVDFAVTGADMYISHPSHIDKVATDFPELHICGTTMGWPWNMEYMAVAMRHKNVWINLECYETKFLTTPGFGFDSMLEFLRNGRLTDKLCFASFERGQHIPLKRLVEEVKELPLPEETIDKILRYNAEKFLGLA